MYDDGDNRVKLIIYVLDQGDNTVKGMLRLINVFYGGDNTLRLSMLISKILKG